MNTYPTKEYFLEEYVNNNKSRDQLAKENNVSISTIKSHLYKYGIRKPDKNIDNKICELYQATNMTIKEIAKELNCGRNYVSKVLNKTNIKINNKYEQYDNSLDDEWIDLYMNKNMNLSQIARRYNVTHTTVRHHLQKHGIATDDLRLAQRKANGKDAISNDLYNYEVMYDQYVNQKLS